MFRRVSKRDYYLDEARATDFLKINNFPNQRGIDRSHVEYLKRKMREGLFLEAMIKVAILVSEDERRYLVDGQHVCTATVELIRDGVKFNYPLVDVAVYRCPTIDDVAKLYRQCNREKKRSLSHLAEIECTALGVGWDKRVMSLTVSALSYKAGLRNSGDQDRKIELIRPNAEAGNFLNNLLGGKGIKARHLFRGPVFWAIIDTWEKAPRVAQEFWTKIRDFAGLEQGTPEYLLYQWLNTHSIQSSGNAKEGKKHATPEEAYQKSIYAWNAYRDGKNDLRRLNSCKEGAK